MPRIAEHDATLRVLMLNWRDTSNPEGGGSERYVENVANGLAAHGHSVTVFCAAHDHAPPDERRHDVRFVRRGSKMGVYIQALWHIATRRLGSFDVVVDVQNGMPFLSRLVTRRPVVVLVHHVHREQWRVVFGPLRARVGWWIESRLAPWLYRRSQYVAVSEVTRRELVALGVDADRVAVVHNGTETPLLPTAARSEQPTLCVLGRLVPHKRVEHALLAVKALRSELPGLQLTVIGHGWWDRELRRTAADLGLLDCVRFTGYVDDVTKHAELSRAWVMLTPSLKEGWGLCVMEAASHGVPTVAYASAGGVAESVQHGETGLLVVDDVDALIMATRLLLLDDAMRDRMGAAARSRANEFSWASSADSFLAVLRSAVHGRLRHDSDPVDPDATAPRGVSVA